MHFLLSVMSVTWNYYLLGIILVPGILFALYAEYKVMKTFNIYNKVPNKNGITAHELASKLLNYIECNDINVKKIDGNLTDNYNHSTKTVSLSQTVYNSASVSALGVTAHEIGHVEQYKEKYAPIFIRNLSIKVSNFTSILLIPLLIFGIIISLFFMSPIGNIIIYIAIGSFGLAFIVNLVTLPVEFNASNRAIKILRQNTTMTDTEIYQVRQVLNAAALTYVASVLLSLLSLIRVILALTMSRR